MANIVEFVSKFEFEEGKTPFARTEVAVSASFIYIGVIFFLRQYMQDKQPMRLKTFAMVHNTNMLVISCVCFVGLCYGIVEKWLKGGMECLLCDASGKETGNGPLYFWLYLFWLSKMYEFLDTVLIVLKKGNLVFLHVYHHWITSMLCFWCLYYRLPSQWVGCLLNALVHIPMYAYYLMVTLDMRGAWWKVYLTQMQITQFCLVIVVQSTSAVWHYKWSGNCVSFETWYKNGLAGLVIVSYLLLFCQFYIYTYRNPPAKEVVKRAEQPRQPVQPEQPVQPGQSEGKKIQ